MYFCIFRTVIQDILAQCVFNFSESVSLPQVVLTFKVMTYVRVNLFNFRVLSCTDLKMHKYAQHMYPQFIKKIRNKFLSFSVHFYHLASFKKWTCIFFIFFVFKAVILFVLNFFGRRDQHFPLYKYFNLLR